METVKNQEKRMIKVLVVEDTPVVREFLIYILGSDPDIEVVGTACNGREAIEALKRKKPDIITMDIHMPDMDGFQATRIIMETQPVPIIIVSGSNSVGEVAMTFKAIEAGALAVIARPKGIGHPDYEATARDLVCTVKLMSEVKVVRRWPRQEKRIASQAAEDKIKKTPQAVQIVAIGASTGGPMALKTILSGIPKGFPVPILIVQHIAVGFLEGFVDWLSQSSGFPAHIASEGELMLPGHAYIAPNGFQMTVKDHNSIHLSKGISSDGLCPSVSYLFESVARVFKKNAVGILLTGMGKDGASELKTMRDNGAITIAQDGASCVVYGMPGEAVKISAATYVLSPEKIAALLAGLAR